MARKESEVSPRSMLGPICWLVVCALLWPALLTFNSGDWPSPHQFPQNDPTQNACGPLGSLAAFQLFRLLGAGSYVLLAFLTVSACVRLYRGKIENAWERFAGLVSVTVSTAVAAQVILGATGSLPVGAGGAVGRSLATLLTANVSQLGTTIILLAFWCVGLIFATQGWILKIPALLGQMWRFPRSISARLRGAFSWMPRLRLVPEGGRTTSHAASEPRPPAIAVAEEEEEEDGEWEYEDEDEEWEEVDEDEEAEEEQDGAAEERRVAAHEKARKALAGPKVNFPSAQRENSAGAYPTKIENWTLPAIELLEEPEYNFSSQQEGRVREQAKILEQTLEEFRLDARVVEIDTGPVITMFELKIGAGIKVSQIGSLSNDIARALKAHAIRVVAPISGKNTVGIEVPNIEKEKVRLRELMDLAGKKASEMNLPLFLGKDAGGAALVADLTKMPHALIAGTTGSGKSVCLNSVILSLLMTKRPDHVKMILIDPKMVEMSQFKDVPHLMCPIVTDMQKAERILEWAVTKMEERYELLAEARVKNIDSFNNLGAEKIYERFEPADEIEKKSIPTHLPFIVIFIDELADLMMTSAKEVEHHLSRLAQKSRAVGIHIIVATQRPEAKVVTGLIKSNLPTRICFRVSSRMDSRIVLDQNGGEVLLGQGDMLFLPPGSHKLIRSQGTYLEDDEVHAVLDDLASRAKPEFHPELMRIRTADANAGSELRDPLFDQGVRIVCESKRGSVSLLQRRLTIGYSRASRLIDQMSEAGLVGEYKGSQAREVLMTIEEWDALKASVAADVQQGYEADEDDEVGSGGSGVFTVSTGDEKEY
jgi:DNA segregation ATPase FtsK/SpoIIIE, S-DNA-T family